MSSGRSATRRHRGLGAVLAALLCLLAACSGGGVGGGSNLVTESPVRFFEFDWEVVDVRRSPVRTEAPAGREFELVEEDGEDVDPSEDYLFVDVGVSNPLDAGGFGIPAEWVTLTDAQGRTIRPFEAFHRETRRNEARLGAENNRTAEYTVSFRIDADHSLDDVWIQLDQQGYLPAALGGPRAVDEQARLPVTFEETTYSGAFSRDEATVTVLEAYWSHELGVDDQGTLIASPDNSSRRPLVDHVWLLVHFEVTCHRTGIATGGCNVSGGSVDVDGQLTTGSVVNGLVGYGDTIAYWAAYNVPVDATSVRVKIGEPDQGVNTDFVVEDLASLQSRATPEGTA